MSVLKSMRNLSGMQFYKTAIDMRRNLTEWLLKDFNSRRNLRSVAQVIKNIDPEDQSVVNKIFEKYGIPSKKSFCTEYPAWFVDSERNIMVKYMAEIIKCITEANYIFPVQAAEWDLRRNLQDKAIGQCFCLYQEIQYIASLFRVDLNRLHRYLYLIEKEIELLKGWRQSDGKRRKEGRT